MRANRSKMMSMLPARTCVVPKLARPLLFQLQRPPDRHSQHPCTCSRALSQAQALAQASRERGSFSPHALPRQTRPLPEDQRRAHQVPGQGDKGWTSIRRPVKNPPKKERKQANSVFQPVSFTSHTPTTTTIRTRVRAQPPHFPTGMRRG